MQSTSPPLAESAPSPYAGSAQIEMVITLMVTAVVYQINPAGMNLIQLIFCVLGLTTTAAGLILRIGARIRKISEKPGFITTVIGTAVIVLATLSHIIW